MTTQDRMLEIAAGALDTASCDQAEMLLSRNRKALTRFAGNAIHQNITTESWHLQARAVKGKKIGIATGTLHDSGAAVRIVERAEAMADSREPLEDFVSLPHNAAGPEPSVAEADLSPASERASVARMVIDTARAAEAVASGAVSEEIEDTFVANSLGVRSCFTTRRCEVMTVVMAGAGAGYGFALADDAARIGTEQLARGAVRTALDSQNPTDLEPGSYTVILEPDATGGLVGFLLYLGFGARLYQEGQAFTSGKVGKKVTGESLTLWDDGHDPSGLPMPFDYEGVPKQRLLLLDKGVVKSVAYDSYYANRQGLASTGHALPAANSFGPFPLNVFMATGDSSVEEMIAGCRQGVLVKRFHYTNAVEPMTVTVTGMTRDGTFLIRNGEIAGPVSNMRFTQGLLDAFTRVVAVSRERRLVDYMGGALAVPAVMIEGFTFTGKTQAM